MQKDSAHADVVWGHCAELLNSSDTCSVVQGTTTLRSLLGIPVFRQVVARTYSAKCGVGSALPHMANWSPATRCIHAALQLLVAQHSDERVLHDVLASLQLLLAANCGSEAVVAVCNNGGPAANDKISISLWQLSVRLTVLALHPIPSLACDAVIALSLLSCHAAGAAVCVLSRAAPLLCWQVMCRCLQAISAGPSSTVTAEGVGENLNSDEAGISLNAQAEDGEQQLSQELEQRQFRDTGDVSACSDANIGEAELRQEVGEQQLSQELEQRQFRDTGDVSACSDASIGEAELRQEQSAGFTCPDGNSGEAEQQEEPCLALPSPTPSSSSHSVKAFAQRNFMSDLIHGSSEHSFVVGCNMTCDAFLLSPGVAELLLYCTMHACINFCTVCMSLKRVPSQKHDSASANALVSCSFGCNSYSFGSDGIAVSDTDVRALFTSLLRYRSYSQAQYSACLTDAKPASLPVLATLKLTPPHDFICQLAHQSSPPLHVGDSAQTSAAYLLHLTIYDAPTKDTSPFAAFLTEHYFVSILTTQVVAGALRLRHGNATLPSSRSAFVCSDLTFSALRCLAFLASNVKLSHVFVRPDSALAPTSGVAACLRGFPSGTGSSVDRFAADSPQARLQCLEQSISGLTGDSSPADILNMLCDEQTAYVMTTADIVSASSSGGDSIQRCAFGRLLLMEPFLSNAVSYILHNASSLQLLPRFALVSSHVIMGTRVELGRCSGVMNASFSWDGPSVVEGGVKHHPSLFPFASLNTIDCELICLSLLVAAAEGGHGWFVLSAGGGCQFFSARGSIMAFGNVMSRSAHFLQKIQQPGASSFSDALYLSFQQSHLRGRALATDTTSQQFDLPHTPRTPRGKRDNSGDNVPLSPLFAANLQTESASLVMSQYILLLYYLTEDRGWLESGGALPCSFGCIIDPLESVLADADLLTSQSSVLANTAALASKFVPSCVTSTSASVVVSAGSPSNQNDYPSSQQPRRPDHRGNGTNGIVCPGSDMCAHNARHFMVQDNALLCGVLQAAVANHALIRGGRAHQHVCLLSLSVLDNATSTIAAAAPLASAIQAQLCESPQSTPGTAINLARLKASVRSVLKCGAVATDEQEAAVFASTALSPSDNAAVESLNQVPVIIRHLFDMFAAAAAEERSSHSLIRAAFSHGTELVAARLIMKLLPLQSNIEVVAQLVAANYATAWCGIVKSCDDKMFFNACFVDGGVSHTSGLAMCTRPLMRFCVGAAMGLRQSELLPAQPIDHSQSISFLTRYLTQFYTDVADRTLLESRTNSGVLHPITAVLAWKCTMNIVAPDRFYATSHLADANCSLLSIFLPCTKIDSTPSELFAASEFHVHNRQRHHFPIQQESALLSLQMMACLIVQSRSSYTLPALPKNSDSMSITMAQLAILQRDYILQSVCAAATQSFALLNLETLHHWWDICIALDAIRLGSADSSAVDLPREVVQVTNEAERTAFARESCVLILVSSILSVVTSADWQTTSKSALPTIKCGVHAMLEYEPFVIHVIKHILSTMISEFECLDPKSYTFALTRSVVGDDGNEEEVSNLQELLSISPASFDCATLHYCLCVLEQISCHSKEIPPKPEVAADTIWRGDDTDSQASMSDNDEDVGKIQGNELADAEIVHESTRTGSVDMSRLVCDWTAIVSFLLPQCGEYLCMERGRNNPRLSGISLAALVAGRSSSALCRCDSTVVVKQGIACVVNIRGLPELLYQVLTRCKNECTLERATATVANLASCQGGEGVRRLMFPVHSLFLDNKIGQESARRRLLQEEAEPIEALSDVDQSNSTQLADSPNEKSRLDTFLPKRTSQNQDDVSDPTPLTDPALDHPYACVDFQAALVRLLVVHSNDSKSCPVVSNALRALGCILKPTAPPKPVKHVISGNSSATVGGSGGATGNWFVQLRQYQFKSGHDLQALPLCECAMSLVALWRPKRLGLQHDVRNQNVVSSWAEAVYSDIADAALDLMDAGLRWSSKSMPHQYCGCVVLDYYTPKQVVGPKDVQGLQSLTVSLYLSTLNCVACLMPVLKRSAHYAVSDLDQEAKMKKIAVHEPPEDRFCLGLALKLLLYITGTSAGVVFLQEDLEIAVHMAGLLYSKEQDVILNVATILSILLEGMRESSRQIIASSFTAIVPNLLDLISFSKTLNSQQLFRCKPNSRSQSHIAYQIQEMERYDGCGEISSAALRSLSCLALVASARESVVSTPMYLGRLALALNDVRSSDEMFVNAAAVVDRICDGSRGSVDCVTAIPFERGDLMPMITFRPQLYSRFSDRAKNAPSKILLGLIARGVRGGLQLLQCTMLLSREHPSVQLLIPLLRSSDATTVSPPTTLPAHAPSSQSASLDPFADAIKLLSSSNVKLEDCYKAIRIVRPLNRAYIKTSRLEREREHGFNHSIQAIHKIYSRIHGQDSANASPALLALQNSATVAFLSTGALELWIKLLAIGIELYASKDALRGGVVRDFRSNKAGTKAMAKLQSNRSAGSVSDADAVVVFSDLFDSRSRTVMSLENMSAMVEILALIAKTSVGQFVMLHNIFLIKLLAACLGLPQIKIASAAFKTLDHLTTTLSGKLTVLAITVPCHLGLLGSSTPAVRGKACKAIADLIDLAGAPEVFLSIPLVSGTVRHGVTSHTAFETNSLMGLRNLLFMLRGEDLRAAIMSLPSWEQWDGWGEDDESAVHFALKILSRVTGILPGTVAIVRALGITLVPSTDIDKCSVSIAEFGLEFLSSRLVPRSTAGSDEALYHACLVVRNLSRTDEGLAGLIVTPSIIKRLLDLIDPDELRECVHRCIDAGQSAHSEFSTAVSGSFGVVMRAALVADTLANLSSVWAGRSAVYQKCDPAHLTRISRTIIALVDACSEHCSGFHESQAWPPVCMQAQQIVCHCCRLLSFLVSCDSRDLFTPISGEQTAHEGFDASSYSTSEATRNLLSAMQDQLHSQECKFGDAAAWLLGASHVVLVGTDNAAARSALGSIDLTCAFAVAAMGEVLQEKNPPVSTQIMLNPLDESSDEGCVCECTVVAPPSTLHRVVVCASRCCRLLQRVPYFLEAVSAALSGPLRIGPFFLGAATHAAQVMLALHSHQSSRSILFASLMTSESLTASRAISEIALTLLNECDGQTSQTSSKAESMFERAALKTIKSQSKSVNRKHNSAAQNQASMRTSFATDETAWLLGASWSTAANDVASFKFLTAMQEFVSTSKTDVNAVPGLLGISPELAETHRTATMALLHLAILGDSTCALVALSAINALAGGCAATRISLHLTEIPTFFEPPEPQTNSLDVDDVVGSRVYPCVPLGALSVVSATSSELLIAELIEKQEAGTWECVTGWLNSLNERGKEARRQAAASAHALHLSGVQVRHVSGIDTCRVRDINDVYGYLARTTSGGHADALECSSGCVAGIRLLLNCITYRNTGTSTAADSANDTLNGRERLWGMSMLQILALMCSSAQNAVSVLALDTLCQLVTLPVISVNASPVTTRATRVYVAEVERALKSVWGPTAIKTLMDAVVTADSRAAARSAALSLHTVYRDSWGSHWYSAACMLGCNTSVLSIPALSETAADSWIREISAGMSYYKACSAVVASCGWSPAAILQMAASKDFSLVCSLVQSDIWNETVGPIACSGCVLNDLATCRNRFVDVVPVWLGLLAREDVPSTTNEGDVDFAASVESFSSATDACRVVNALCSCVALFDVSNAQCVNWVHVDTNGLFWGFCVEGVLREYKHRWSYTNSKCCFFGRCVALAALTRIMSFNGGSYRRIADSSFPAVYVDDSNTSPLGNGRRSGRTAMVALLNELMFSSSRCLAELSLRSLLLLQTAEEAKPIVFSHAPDLLPAAVRCLAQSVHVSHQLQARAAAACIQNAMMLSVSKSADEESSSVLRACDAAVVSVSGAAVVSPGSNLPLVIGFWSVALVVASVADLCVLPPARDATSRMDAESCAALEAHRAKVSAAKQEAAELKKKIRAKASAAKKLVSSYSYDAENQSELDPENGSIVGNEHEQDEGYSEDETSQGIVIDTMNSCFNVRRSQAHSDCGFGRLKFVQAPAGAASDLGHEVESDPTHFAPLDGIWKEDGDDETFDMDDGSLVYGTVGLLFCSSSAGCVVDCLRAISRMSHDSHLRQSIVTQPGLLQLLCAFATKGGCAQTNEDYSLVMEVAQLTVLEIENSSTKLKLKWGGSEARNRRRLPATDDVATLLQQDGRLGEYAFFALRSLLDIQNFLIQRQKKLDEMANTRVLFF